MKYSIPTLIALCQDTDIVCRWAKNIEDCHLLRPHQAKKPILSETSLNRLVKESVSKSQLARPTKGPRSKARSNCPSSPILKSHPQPTFAVSDAGFARFLREHSSPPHQRVTAGGRIVPMEPAQEIMPSDEHTPSEAQNVHFEAMAESSANSIHPHHHLMHGSAATYYAPSVVAASGPPQIAGPAGLAYGPPAAYNAAFAVPVGMPPLNDTIEAPIPLWTPVTPNAAFPLPVRGLPQMVGPPGPLHGPGIVYRAPFTAPPGGSDSNIFGNRLDPFPQYKPYRVGDKPIVSFNCPSSTFADDSNFSAEPNMNAVLYPTDKMPLDLAFLMLPTHGGIPGIMLNEFRSLLGIFQGDPGQNLLDLAYVRSILTRAMISNVEIELGEDWQAACVTLDNLIMLCERNLDVVNERAASHPQTDDRSVILRRYYTNLRAMLTTFYDNLTGHWPDLSHIVAGTQGELAMHATYGNSSGVSLAEVGGNFIQSEAYSTREINIPAYEAEINNRARFGQYDGASEDLPVGRRAKIANSFSRALGRSHGRSGRSESVSSDTQPLLEPAREAEDEKVVSGLSDNEPEVMSHGTAAGEATGIGNALTSVGLGDQAGERDGVVATHVGEPGAPVHRDNAAVGKLPVTTPSSVPVGTTTTTWGRSVPILTSILARISGRDAAVPRSPASVVADTTTINPPPSDPKPGETLSAGRFLID